MLDNEYEWNALLTKVGKFGASVKYKYLCTLFTNNIFKKNQTALICEIKKWNKIETQLEVEDYYSKCYELVVKELHYMINKKLQYTYHEFCTTVGWKLKMLVQTDVRRLCQIKNRAVTFADNYDYDLFNTKYRIRDHVGDERRPVDEIIHNKELCLQMYSNMNAIQKHIFKEKLYGTDVDEICKKLRINKNTFYYELRNIKKNQNLYNLYKLLK